MKRKDPFKRHRFPREIFLRSAELHLMLHPSTDGFASLDLKSLKDRSSTRLVVASPDMFPFGTLLGNALRAADET